MRLVALRAEAAAGLGFLDVQTKGLGSLTSIQELMAATAARRDKLIEARAKIDDERVQLLAGRLKGVDQKIRAADMDMPAMRAFS